MRRPPPLSDFIKYPVAGGTIALAVLITFASWSGKFDVTPLHETVDIRRGQLWRLLTSTLPHANFIHLLFNVIFTWIFGTLVEETFGHFRTLAIFVLLAVAANGAEYAFLSGGMGLSGVGYGLFGLLWVLSSRDPRFTDVVDRQTVRLFVGWFFFCIAITYAGYPIGNVAHGVGAITGALLGWAIAARSNLRLQARRDEFSSPGWKFTRYRKEQALAVALLVILVVGVFAGATVARPWINFSTDRGLDEGKLGYDALIAGRDAEALRWFRDAAHMRPHEASYWYNMGIAYGRLNRQAEAISAFKQAHNLDPSNADYRAVAQDDR